MPEPASERRRHVFLSYARADRPWVERLKQMIKPLLVQGKRQLQLWDDSQIEAGTPWRDAIHQALAEAGVAVFLVSAEFLASEFVMNEELPALLAAAEREGVRIFWVSLSACLVEYTPIYAYQAAWPPERPLASLDSHEQEEALRAICLAIGEALKPQPIPESMATLQLGDRRRRPLPQTPSGSVILLDPEMPGRLQLSPSQIFLYKNITLESIGDNKNRLADLYGDEIEVLTPEDFFLPELCLLPGGCALKNSWLNSQMEGEPVLNGHPVTPLLPLQERIRDLFSSAELSCFCSLRVEADGKHLEFTLRLPLQGQQQPYPITRIYPIQAHNLIDEVLPVIALWPYISEQNWHWYVLFTEDRDDALSVDGFVDYQLRKAREGSESVKYFYCDHLPDLIKLKLQDQYRGFIPVIPPPPNAPAANVWRVGLDFGTSFTNFFIDEGFGPVRKPLETRVISLTLAEIEKKFDLLPKFFIPEKLFPIDRNPPISTALNTYGWLERKGAVPEIFHQARIQWPIPNSQSLRKIGIHTGFKWRHMQYAYPFLKQLALMISCNVAAAGARSVGWAISYPSNLSSTDSSNYKSFWINLFKYVTLLSGMNHHILSENGREEFQAEAVAFASFFRNQLDRQMVHAACLDVGGRNTTMSFWQNNILLHQASFPYASHDMITLVLKQNPSFTHFLFNTDYISGDEAKLRSGPCFDTWLADALRLQSEDFRKERMPIHRSEQNKQLLAFVSLMAISFAGFYHYLGLILRALHQEGQLLKPAPAPVYLGGNGARFLHWLDESGSFSKGCDSDLLLESIQGLSSGFTAGNIGSACTSLSPAFGEETACGLISSGASLRWDDKYRNDLMIAGEEIFMNGKTSKALDLISNPGNINEINNYEVANLKELQRFLQNYDGALIALRINSLLPLSRLAPMETLWDEVEMQVKSICLEYSGKESSDQRLEPAFIIGLRALIRTLSRHWAERY